MPPVTSFPQWAKPSLAPSPVVPPYTLLPLSRPPKATAPAHPARPDFPAPPVGFTRTLHAAPSAWPKQLKESRGSCVRESAPFGPEPKGSESKEERGRRIVAERDYSIKVRHGATEWGADEAKDGGQPAQWNVAERWRRDEPVDGGIVLVVTHANGLGKELWYPALNRALSKTPTTKGGLFGTNNPLSKPTNTAVNEVWLLEDTHHGSSVDLNSGKLSEIYSWMDNARDSLNFVQHVLPTAVGKRDVPYQLSWSDTERAPPVVGVGHSIGGNGLVHAAVAKPELFSALFLTEPMVQPGLGNAQAKVGYPIPLAALKRRSEWPSAADAATMRTNPLFKAWDQDVFDLFISHSLVPYGSGKEVQLATPRWAEAAIFSDPNGTQRGWDRLPELTVPVGFVMGEDSSWMGGTQCANEIVWRPRRARNERVLGCGHLIVQEKPTEVAEALWRFLTTLQAGEWDAVAAKH